jgi:hypothetical protein
MVVERWPNLPEDTQKSIVKLVQEADTGGR